MRVAQQLILETVERPLGIMPFRFDRDKVGEPSSFSFAFSLVIASLCTGSTSRANK